MEKRGVLEQPFYYIFAIILISLIFIFGYQQIIRLQNLNEQAKFVTFKSDFQDAINNIYYKNQGSVITYSLDSQNKPLMLPKDVKKICFKKINNDAEVNAESKYSTNFIVNNLVPKEGFSFKIENNEYCAEIINSKFSFRLENKFINQGTIVEIR
ncbi:MAG: hypothetical protein AABX61_01855 [Nanoarchaeota archaeon]